MGDMRHNDGVSDDVYTVLTSVRETSALRATSFQSQTDHPLPSHPSLPLGGGAAAASEPSLVITAAVMNGLLRRDEMR